MRRRACFQYGRHLHPLCQPTHPHPPRPKLPPPIAVVAHYDKSPWQPSVRRRRPTNATPTPQTDRRRPHREREQTRFICTRRDCCRPSAIRKRFAACACVGICGRRSGRHPRPVPCLIAQPGPTITRGPATTTTTTGGETGRRSSGTCKSRPDAGIVIGCDASACVCDLHGVDGAAWFGG